MNKALVLYPAERTAKTDQTGHQKGMRSEQACFRKKRLSTKKRGNPSVTVQKTPDLDIHILVKIETFVSTVLAERGNPLKRGRCSLCTVLMQGK